MCRFVDFCEPASFIQDVSLVWMKFTGGSSAVSMCLSPMMWNPAVFYGRITSCMLFRCISITIKRDVVPLHTTLCRTLVLCEWMHVYKISMYKTYEKIMVTQFFFFSFFNWIEMLMGACTFSVLFLQIASMNKYSWVMTRVHCIHTAVFVLNQPVHPV